MLYRVHVREGAVHAVVARGRGGSGGPDKWESRVVLLNGGGTWNVRRFERGIFFSRVLEGMQLW